MSISNDDLRQLVARREDPFLEFKEKFYERDDKSEMAKDIMAMANNLNDGEVGHILFGVIENPEDNTGIIKGLDIPEWATDSNLQQMVHSRLNRPPWFSWSRLLIDELTVGVIEIRAGGRPFFPLKDDKHLKRFVASRRVGSSTDIASPEDIIKWFRADDSQRNRDLETELKEQQLKILPRIFEGQVLHDNGRREQQISVINDGHALFSVESASVVWGLRLPEPIERDHGDMQSRLAEICPVTLTEDLRASPRVLKSNEYVDLELETRLKALRSHFDQCFVELERQEITMGLAFVDLLHGTFSAKCKSPSGSRTAIVSATIQWQDY